MKIQKLKLSKAGPAGGNLVRVAPKTGSGHRHNCQKARTGECCGGSGGCRCGGANEMEKNAKSKGGQKQETVTIVVLDDEALNRNSTARMIKQAAKKVGFKMGKLKVLTAATVEQAMEQILSNEVSLIVLDRKIEGGRWGGEVIEQLLEKAPGKVDCAVMCTGSPLKVEAWIVGAIGRSRVFGKLRDQGKLMHLMEHVLKGGNVEGWERPSKEELMPEEGGVPGEPTKLARKRPTWI